LLLLLPEEERHTASNADLRCRIWTKESTHWMFAEVFFQISTERSGVARKLSFILQCRVLVKLAALILRHSGNPKGTIKTQTEVCKYGSTLQFQMVTRFSSTIASVEVWPCGFGAVFSIPCIGSLLESAGTPNTLLCCGNLGCMNCTAVFGHENPVDGAEEDNPAIFVT